MSPEKNSGAEHLPIKISLTEHVGKNDENGKEVSTGHFENGQYHVKVTAGLLIRVRVQATRGLIRFVPHYVNADGTVWEEDEIELKNRGQSIELPYPTQVDVGEKIHGWTLVRASNREVLMQVLFSLRDSTEVESAPASNGAAAGATDDSGQQMSDGDDEVYQLMYCEPHEFPTPTKPTPAQRKKLFAIRNNQGKEGGKGPADRSFTS